MAQLPGATATLTHITALLYEQWRLLNPYVIGPPRLLSNLSDPPPARINIRLLRSRVHTLSMPASLFSSSWPTPVVTSILSCAIVAVLSLFFSREHVFFHLLVSVTLPPIFASVLFFAHRIAFGPWQPRSGILRRQFYRASICYPCSHGSECLA